jgi:Fic-DOC domain mobile mystery protein B
MNDGTGTAGATAGDDLSGLIPTRLTDQRSRNAAELESVARAYDKHVFRARRKKPGSEWFTDEFLRRVHRDMFGSVWDWAGKYRTVPVNIGVEWHAVPEQVRLLCGDFARWDSPQSTMPVVEIAARLQNRLTRIHPFKNGNGRHARLITDIFFHSRRHPLPQWPQLQRLPQGDSIRARYISAMKKADGEDYGELMEFIDECFPRTA